MASRVGPPDVSHIVATIEKLPKKVTPWEESTLPVDFLFLTVKDCEFLACLSYFKEIFKRYYKLLGFVYFGDIGGHKIALIKSFSGPGAGGSIVVVKNAVVVLRPKAVFYVGFCGSLNYEKVKLGDVVVSAKLITYAPTKVVKDGIQERGINVPPKKDLANLIKHAGESWEPPLTDLEALDVTVHRDGVFLSGPEVVDNKDRRKELIERFPQAIAIEMGGEGLVIAAHDLELKWVVIKGVSELADGKKSDTESWRPFASVMAASLVADILSDPVAFRDWPHYQDPSSVPIEIQTRGPEAQIAFQNAMQYGEVQVYRGRVMFIGQDGAGKTSLKNYLLGIPFNPQEDSTVGIEIDPSKFEVEVSQVKNWQRAEQKAPGVHEFHDNIAMLIATALEQHSRSEEENVTANDSGTMNTVRAAPSSKKLASGTMQEINTEATMQNDLPSENVIKSGLPDLDIDTKLVFSNDLMDQVMRCLDHQKLKDDIKAKEYTLNMWDFAGQHLYYASHPVFLSSRAVYILVCNLSKDLNAVAEPCVRQGTVKPLKNPNGETNLENLLSWLVSVYRLRTRKNDVVCRTDGKPYYVRPPAFIVGTHAAHPAVEDVNEMLECIQKSLTAKGEIQQHVIRPIFSVDNTRSLGDNDLEKLREKIQEVLYLEPYMGESIPIRWFHFEKIVQALVSKNIYHVKLEDLQSVIRRHCGIDDKEEMALMLDFYHDLGEIVKYGNTVVMKTQWLIDLFKQLITVRPFQESDPCITDWYKLEEHGILTMELIDHVFHEHIKRGLEKEDILNLMELYGLIAKFLPESGTEKPRYFVPAQLQSPPPKLCEKKTSCSDPCSLYLTFPDGFVPHGLFPQLLSRCIVWSSKCGFQKEPNLFQCVARFFIGKEKQTIYSLVLICRKRSIKVVLTQISSSKSSKELEPKDVWVFLNETLVDLSEKLPWLRNLKYEWCVACTVCQCVKHEAICCVHEECLHLHPVAMDSPKTPIICENSFDDEVVKVPGLDKWFQVTQESKIEEADKKNHSSAADGSDPHLKRKASSTSTQDPGESASKSRKLSDKSITQKSEQTTLEVVESEDEPVTKQRSPEEATTSNTQTTSGAREGNENVKTCELSRDDLEGLSRQLGTKWEGLARRLDFTEAEIEGFGEEKELSTRAYRMLIAWYRKKGSEATYEALHHALCHDFVGLKKEAQDVCCVKTAVVQMS